MAGIVAGTRPNYCGRRPLATLGRRRVLLPEFVGARVRACQHVHLWARPVERLPLLLRPRHVGHRVLRRPGAHAASARRGAEPAGIPADRARLGARERQVEGPSRHPVPVGERASAGRRGCPRQRQGVVVRGPRLARCRLGLRLIRPCDRRWALPVAGHRARSLRGRRLDCQPCGAQRSRLRVPPVDGHRRAGSMERRRRFHGDGRAARPD